MKLIWEVYVWLETLRLVPKETVSEFALHWPFSLDEILTGHIRNYLLWQQVDDLVLVDVEHTLFLGIDSTILQ